MDLTLAEAPTRARVMTRVTATYIKTKLLTAVRELNERVSTLHEILLPPVVRDRAMRPLFGLLHLLSFHYQSQSTSTSSRPPV